MQNEDFPMMPSNELMLSKKIPVGQMMQYFNNLWMRNVAANIVDIMADEKRKAENPQELVEGDDQRNRGNMLPVAVRLELRKQRLQTGLAIYNATVKALELGDEALMAKYTSEEFLKIDESVFLPPTPPSDTTPPAETQTELKVEEPAAEAAPAVTENIAGMAAGPTEQTDKAEEEALSAAELPAPGAIEQAK